MYSERENQFVSQSTLFSRLAREEAAAIDLPLRCSQQLRPIVLRDSSCLTESERTGIVEQYREEGVGYFIDLTLRSGRPVRHPLFTIVDQLAGLLNLNFPLKHPLEDHPQTVSRFGSCDATVKVYNLAKNSSSYREQGETSEKFEMHHDGLGSAGSVENVVLYMDSAPLWGGVTYFQNIARLALKLEESDPEAYESLFLPRRSNYYSSQRQGCA